MRALLTDNQGHADGRIVHASFKDLIPSREMREVSLARPSEDHVAEVREKTKAALAALVGSAVTAQNPNRNTTKREATYVKYTPAKNQMGDNSKKQDRIIKVVERQKDPTEPPKFKHKKIPRVRTI